MRLSPMASMKPHQLEVQLLWVLDLVVVEVHVEVLQLLLPEQEASCWLPCVAVLLHHVGFDLLDECVGGTLALHSWLSAHLHVLGHFQPKKQNHALNLRLQ